jgi:manganese/zinc/iron transport system permease protein
MFDMETFWRVLSLQDHNTRIVLAGACVFGGAAGLVGMFLLLRKRSLLGDTIGHATLPGIAGAFLLAHTLGWNARSFIWLATGAAISGIAGMFAVLIIRKFSRIKDDASLAVVLGVFFGTGVALLSAIQQLPGGQAAGLENLIYGSAASMVTRDALFIFGSAIVVVFAGVFLFKEFSILCFDEAFASAAGWPVRTLDVLLMSGVVLVTVIGLQSVGILLTVALLVIPPTAARFWTDSLGKTAVISALNGSASAFVGVALSAVFPKMPTGAIIVLAAAFLFGCGFFFGTRRGLWSRFLMEWRAKERLENEHMLRAIFECSEFSGPAISHEAVLAKRPWTRNETTLLISRLAENGLVTVSPEADTIQLTRAGDIEARRLVRNHRLWELYLLNHADVAPSRVDRDADLIEHVLDPRLVEELECILENRAHFVPADPVGNPS